MAFWEKQNQQLAIEVAVLKKEIELLKEQLAFKDRHIATQAQSLDRAYEALTAKEAPEAYRDRKLEEPPRPLTGEEKRLRALAEANRQLLIDTEAELFKSPEDMISTLQQVLGGPSLKSLHNNEES